VACGTSPTCSAENTLLLSPASAPSSSLLSGGLLVKNPQLDLAEAEVAHLPPSQWEHFSACLNDAAPFAAILL
jgi:hypothetical protein